MNIETYNKTLHAKYTIYNNLGQIVLTDKLENLQINCSLLKAGLYLLVITDKYQRMGVIY